jgi:hypothetical protein
MAGLPVTPEAVAQRVSSIRDAATRVSTAIDAYADISTKAATGHGPSADTTSSQAQLLGDIKKLLAEVQGPFGAMLDLFGSLTKLAALRCLAEVGVFTALPSNGEPATVDEILSRLDVDVEKALLARFLRTAAAEGPLVELDEETYAQTAFSGVMVHPELAATFKHLVDESGPAITLMPQFFIENGWKQPTDPSNCPVSKALEVEVPFTLPREPDVFGFSSSGY